MKQKLKDILNNSKLAFSTLAVGMAADSLSTADFISKSIILEKNLVARHLYENFGFLTGDISYTAAVAGSLFGAAFITNKISRRFNVKVGNIFPYFCAASSMYACLHNIIVFH